MTTNETIRVLTTGGTLDKVYFDARSTFEVGDTVVHQLLSEAHVKAPYVVEELMRKDSLELTEDDRLVIRHAVEQAEESRIVITHGTDTMTDTASFLNSVRGKTIVLTGALAPARFAFTDATFNVGMAFAAVQALDPGVYIVMNGTLFREGKVIKDKASNTFISL